jgi:transcription elongation GreA/GreB family factor
MASGMMNTAPVIDKTHLIGQLAEQLEAELALMAAAHKQTTDGVTHDESRAENDKDTRALESSYLARGQASRVADLTAGLQKLKTVVPRSFDPTSPIALGAVVTLDDGTREFSYFLAPAGGGARLQNRDSTILVVTPESPLGAALLGKRLGDDVDVRTPQGVRECSVVSVQ